MLGCEVGHEPRAALSPHGEDAPAPAGGSRGQRDIPRMLSFQQAEAASSGKPLGNAPALPAAQGTVQPGGKTTALATRAPPWTPDPPLTPLVL